MKLSLRPVTESTPVTSATWQSQADGFIDRLLQEHDACASQLASLERSADVIGNERVRFSTLSTELDHAYELLSGRILPHIRAADDYQTALARHDYVSPPAHREHEETERLTSELGSLRDRVRGGNIAGARPVARRLLYELLALTRPHFGVPRRPKP